LTLPVESEEVAGFFAAMIETDHAKDATFKENFFRDFKKMLEEYPPVSRHTNSILS
jgi:DNA topoisomerase-1